MDEFVDDLREAQQENAAEAAGDEESDDGLKEEWDGELGEESDGDSDEESDEVVRDAIRKLQAGETILLYVARALLCACDPVSPRASLTLLSSLLAAACSTTRSATRAPRRFRRRSRATRR